MPRVTTRAPASAKQTWRKVMHNSYGQLNDVICTVAQKGHRSKETNTKRKKSPRK